MSKIVFTADQMAALKPYEPNFKTVVEAHYTRCILQSGIDTMLRVWKEVTGHERIGFRNGCEACRIHLIQDLAVPYFAQKKEMETAVAVPQPSVNEQSPVKAGKTTSKKKTPAKSKKTTKK